jgi:hypothetical protein
VYVVLAAVLHFGKTLTFISNGSFSPVFAETTFGGVVRGVVGIGEAWAVTSYVRATSRRYARLESDLAGSHSGF